MDEEVDLKKGLTSKQVQDRIDKGLVNYDETPKTKTVKEIVKDNFFNYFNFLNLALGIMAFVAGIMNSTLFNALKNCLFMGVIITNSLISIIEEVISKRITDKLSIINSNKISVIRDGEDYVVNVDELVIDDIVIYSPGVQVAADSELVSGEIEVNESFITGESDSIRKKKGDQILSGSFIVSGEATGRVIHVGKDNYISEISIEAKENKIVKSVIMNSFEKLLKVLSVLIIPMGILMFISQFSITNSIPKSMIATVSSMIGMIPEGLVLLTSSVMAVGVIKLYQNEVLVQQLNAIETLARVDTICLDKTGTLTEGRMRVVDILPREDYTKEELDDLLCLYASSSNDKNSTMMALKERFKASKVKTSNQIFFSSERKYSALEFNDYSVYLGAPDVIGGAKALKDISDYNGEFRVVAIGKKKGGLDSDLKNIELVGYVLIEDVIRPSAKETLDYFKDNKVDVKIISGDNAKTVLNIANKVGIKNATGIDIGELSREEVEALIEKNQIFGRVKPNQKKWIISYLRSKGHVVAMTGDGVNDVMALRESDCAISIKSGTDAARNVSQLILLNDDFNSLPRVVQEGRQTINNVERSASLLLVKTIYTILLSIFSIVTKQAYFFVPIQLTLITQVTIGTPSFILALETNNELVKGNFLLKVLARSLPAALTVVYNVCIVSAFTILFGLSSTMQSTLSVYLTAITGLFYLYKICRPFTLLRGSLLSVMTIIFTICILYFPAFFELEKFSAPILLIVFVLCSSSIIIYKVLEFLLTRFFHLFDDSIKEV